MLRAWLILLALIGVPVGLAWYATTADTGPIGWLNAMQASNTGSYSRALSAVILFAAVGLVAAPVLGLWAVLRKKFPAPAPAARPGAPAPMTFRDAFEPGSVQALRLRRRTGFVAWAVGFVLIWAGVFAWNAWDWHQRLADANDSYAPLRLTRDARVARPDAGAHVALQGRLLWDRAVSKREKTGTSTVVTAYVPMVAADWRPGDAVQFVAQLEQGRAYWLQHRVPPVEGPLLARVGAAIPTASRAVFQQEEAPPTDDAVLLEVIESQGGQVADARPAFDLSMALILSAVFSGFWTFIALAVLLRVWLDGRKARRQLAKPAA